MLTIKLANGEEVQVKEKQSIPVKLKDGSVLFISKPKVDIKIKNMIKHDHDVDVQLREDLVHANNALSDETNNLVSQQQASLQNAVQNVEAQMVASMIAHIEKTNNAFDDQDEVMTESEKKKYIAELTLIVSAYYKTLFPIYANQLINKRATEFGIQVPFKMTRDVEKYIKITATNASQSHVNTIIDDILKTAKAAYQDNLDTIVDGLKAQKTYTDAEIYELARKRALEGASQRNIIGSITKEYQNISNNRAKTIARTETNRAFTQSQYQADLQFLNSSGLMGQAYKKWQTRSTNPCNYCLSLANSVEIPFETNFRDLGEEITAPYTKKDGTTVMRSLKVNYEELSAGNAHVNCSCRYVLIVK